MSREIQRKEKDIQVAIFPFLPSGPGAKEGKSDQVRSQCLPVSLDQHPRRFLENSLHVPVLPHAQEN
jgi:hypothetical protein